MAPRVDASGDTTLSRQRYPLVVWQGCGVNSTDAIAANPAPPEPRRHRRTFWGFLDTHDGPPPRADGQPRRSPLRVLAQIPGDWLFERSSLPGDIIGVAVIAGTVIGGVAPGTVLAINWICSKVPMATNALRAAYHRDITYWSRPQSHQRRDVAEDPLPPMESDPNAKGVPRIVRWVTRKAEAGSKAATFFDDWLNQRSRVPAFCIEATLLAFGFLVAPIPIVVLFPVNALVLAVPTILGAYLAIRNRDFKRWSRGGMRQRNDILERVGGKGLAGPHLQMRTPSATLSHERAAPDAQSFSQPAARIVAPRPVSRTIAVATRQRPEMDSLGL